MQLFYTERFSGRRAILDGQEFHHACHVLRKQPGDAVQLTNGKGRLFSGILTEVKRDHAIIGIHAEDQEETRSFRIHMAVAPTKKMTRFEWCVEKLTELGVDTIYPLICHRSERRKVAGKRLHKIALAAMKQSLRLTLPEISEPVPMAELVQDLAADVKTKYIAHSCPDAVSLEGHYKAGHDVMLLIGPEGDFTRDELNSAIDSGFIKTSLGRYRLRTETAALAGCHTIHVLNRK